MKLGARIINDVDYTIEIHQELPSESPFKSLAIIACSDTDEEAEAMKSVRVEVGERKMAVAYMAYTKDFPKGTISDFNQLSVEDRRKYFGNEAREIRVASELLSDRRL